MQKTNTLLPFLNRGLLVDPTWFIQQAPYFALMLMGEDLSLDGLLMAKPRAELGEEELVERLRKPVVQHIGTIPVVQSSIYTDFSQAPEGTVAVINISGPIIKSSYWYYCAEDYVEMIKRAETSPNVIAVVIKTDSPGGMVDGTQSVAQRIKACTKPVLGFIYDGMAASAAYWILSSCSEVYAGLKTDSAGSIGVYCHFMDIIPALEELGVKYYEIYARQSTKKNIDYRQLRDKGDDSLIKDDLSFIADEFIQAVKDNRGDRLKITKANDPMEGELFFSPQAKAIGLIDDILSWEEVISRASGLAGGTADPLVMSTESNPEDEMPTEDIPEEENPDASVAPPRSPEGEDSNQANSENMIKLNLFGKKPTESGLSKLEELLSNSKEGKAVSLELIEEANAEVTAFTGAGNIILIGAEAHSEMAASLAALKPLALEIFGDTAKGENFDLEAAMKHMKSQLTEAIAAKAAAEEKLQALGSLEADVFGEAAKAEGFDAAAILKEMKGDSDSVQERVAGLQQEVERLGAMDGGLKFGAIQKPDTIGQDDAQKAIDNLPHNKRADELTGK